MFSGLKRSGSNLKRELNSTKKCVNAVWMRWKVYLNFLKLWPLLYLLGSGHKFGSWRTMPNGRRIGVWKIKYNKIGIGNWHRELAKGRKVKSIKQFGYEKIVMFQLKVFSTFLVKDTFFQKYCSDLAVALISLQWHSTQFCPDWLFSLYMKTCCLATTNHNKDEHRF